MTDTISSASTASVVPAAVHKSIVAEFEAEIAALEADAKALWSHKAVFVAVVVAFILGFVVRWIV